MGRVVLLFWAGGVPYYSSMLPGLNLEAVMGSWHWPRQVWWRHLLRRHNQRYSACCGHILLAAFAPWKVP